MCRFEAASEVDLSGTTFLGRVAEDPTAEEPLRAQTPEEGEPLV